MKKLTKEQLTEMVYGTMVKVYRSNEENLMNQICDSGKETDNPCLKIVNAMGVFGAEIMRECSQVLIETLYDILYTE